MREPTKIDRREFLVSVSGLVFASGSAAAQDPDAASVQTEMFDDFEQGYGRWEITGTAFGTEPARGTLPNQQKVSGYHGEHCVNTFLNGDGATGRATSRPFEIRKPYITFLIGGGSDTATVALRLLVDGKVVETASGKNDEKLEPDCWNVSRWIGHKARFQIVDEATGAWGHILVDDLAFAMHPPTVPRLPLVHNYLIVPVYFDDTAGIRPHAIDYYQTLMGSRWPGLDHYFKSVSGGQATLAGTKVWNWTRMSGRAIDYAGEPNEQGKRAYDFRKLLDGLRRWAEGDALAHSRATMQRPKLDGVRRQ